MKTNEFRKFAPYIEQELTVARAVTGVSSEFRILSVKPLRRSKGPERGSRSRLFVVETTYGQYCIKEHLRHLPELRLLEALRSQRMIRHGGSAISHVGVLAMTSSGTLLPVPPLDRDTRVFSLLEYRPKLQNLAALVRRCARGGTITPELDQMLHAVAFSLRLLHRRRYQRDDGRAIYNLHVQEILAQMAENLVGAGGMNFPLEFAKRFQTLMLENAARLLSRTDRLPPRRIHGDFHDGNINRELNLDLDRSEFGDPAADLAWLAGQWDAGFFESGGNPFFLDLWKRFYCSYSHYRYRSQPYDPKIEEAMSLNYGLKVLVMTNPETMGTERVKGYADVYRQHGLRVLKLGRYVPPHLSHT